MSSGSRPPAPLTVARVLAVLQIVVGVLAAVAGGLAAAAASGTDTTEGSRWGGLLVGLAMAVAVAGVVAAGLLGIPLAVMSGGSPTRRITGRGLLIGGEFLLLVPFVVFAHVRFGTLFALATDPFSLVLDAMLLVPLVVIGLLLVPSVGRWAAAGAEGLAERVS